MLRLSGLATAAAAAIAVAAAGSPAVSTELKFASHVGAHHVMNRKVFEPWAKEVAKLSGGALTIKMYYDGALGKGGAGQFRRAVDGEADIAWSQQGYTAKQFRKTTLIEFPGVGDNPVDATKRMWKVFDPYLASEYDRVKVIALWTLDAPIINTKLKRVRHVDHLKGLKIRTSSQYQAWLIGALGAIPQSVPASMIYDSLDRGLIDGILISPTVIIDLNLDEVTQFHSVGISWGRSPHFAVMNKKTYDGLPRAHREVIDKTSGLPLSIKASQVYTEDRIKGRDLLQADNKRRYIRLAATEVAKADSLLKQAEADIIARVKKEGIDLKPALNALRGAGR